MTEVSTATLPPTICAPWCRDAVGHIDAWHPEDQWCGTWSEGVKLDAAPLVTYSSEPGERFTGKHALDAYLSRDAWSTRTLVNVTYDGSTAIPLTPAEAIPIGEILTRLGHLALGRAASDD